MKRKYELHGTRRARKAATEACAHYIWLGRKAIGRPISLVAARGKAKFMLGGYSRVGLKVDEAYIQVAALAKSAAWLKEVAA